MHCILNILKAARSNLEQAGIRLASILNEGSGRGNMHRTLTPRALQVCVVKRLKEKKKRKNRRRGNLSRWRNAGDLGEMRPWREALTPRYHLPQFLAPVNCTYIGDVSRKETEDNIGEAAENEGRYSSAHYRGDGVHRLRLGK